MFNIEGKTYVERKGTSVYNIYKVEVTVEEIIKLLKTVPYAASTMVGVAPSLRLLDVTIGTNGNFQGKELNYMFVDFTDGTIPTFP